VRRFHSGIKRCYECNRFRTVDLLLATSSIVLCCTISVQKNLHFGGNTQQVRLCRYAETQADLHVGCPLYAPDLNEKRNVSANCSYSSQDMILQKSVKRISGSFLYKDGQRQRFQLAVCIVANRSDHAVEGMNRLHSIERWDRAFESHSRHGWLCAFVLFVLFCV
jgi:hypothetical protein